MKKITLVLLITLVMLVPGISAQAADQTFNIAYGTAVSGILDDATSSHYYRFSGRQGDVIRAFVVGYYGMEPSVGLRTQGGEWLFVDAAGTGDQSIVLIDELRLPETGTYTLVVNTGFTVFGSGEYAVALEQVRAGQSLPPADDIPLGTLSVPSNAPDNAFRLGGFQVEWYCNNQGYGIDLVNGDRDWACTNPNTGQVDFILGRQEFDAICRTWYDSNTAFAVRDMENRILAYTLSCYDFGSAPSRPVQGGDNVEDANIVDGYNLNSQIGTVSPNEFYEVNVRSQATVRSPILGVIDWRDSFPALAREGDWFVINYNGQVGFVSANFTSLR